VDLSDAPYSNSATVHLDAMKLASASLAILKLEDVMERRDFLKLALGFSAGAAALAASAQAAPLAPHPLLENSRLPVPNEEVRPAVATEEDVNNLKPEEVRWGHGRHRGWGRGRHWGWHRRRHWGWRRRHWARRRYW
jgi:hypothetical protein